MPRAKDATSPRRAQGAKSPAAALPGESVDFAALEDALLRWYEACRRDLPWRRTRDPYAIWVSEIMLQQTRVDTVIPYYDRFLAKFPTVLSLAEAAADDVLSAWSGLGYYRRARFLHAGAKAVVEREGGVVPEGRERLRTLPGIGLYTAGAIASIAFGEPVGLVDGTVARVLARIFGIDADMRKEGMRQAETLADRIVSRRDPGAYNQALMELGATICTPRSPSCEACPVARLCVARREGKTELLPKLSAKKAPTACRVQVVVARRGDAIVVGRRTAGGLFGGLWEPPSAEGEASTRAALIAELGVRDPVVAGEVTHVLSHRRMTVDVVVGALTGTAASVPSGYDALRVVAIDALDDLGISTLTRKILAVAEGAAKPRKARRATGR